MSDIRSPLRSHPLETAWALFAGANLVLMAIVPEQQTIPFHLVWISLTVLYGLRVWSLRTTMLVVVAVTLATAGALAWAAGHAGGEIEELSEVPLMAAVFAAMVWHARRRQAALDEVRRLAESERELRREREFTRYASHELRTPITVARGHAELIRAACSGEQPGEDAEVVLDELDRLARISDRLLLLAVANDPDFLRRARVDLGQLAESTEKRWSATAVRRWRLEVLAEGTLLADEERLESALDALIENAIKFTREEDSIWIVARAEGATAVIEVFDTGEGIPPERLSSLFHGLGARNGDRANGDRANGRSGTGLGLAIVKAITEAHGGSVGVVSELGRGTTVRLRLPGFRPAEVKASPVELSATAG